MRKNQNETQSSLFGDTETEKNVKKSKLQKAVEMAAEILGKSADSFIITARKGKKINVEFHLDQEKVHEQELLSVEQLINLHPGVPIPELIWDYLAAQNKRPQTLDMERDAIKMITYAIVDIAVELWPRDDMSAHDIAYFVQHSVDNFRHKRKVGKD